MHVFLTKQKIVFQDKTVKTPTALILPTTPVKAVALPNETASHGGSKA